MNVSVILQTYDKKSQFTTEVVILKKCTKNLAKAFLKATDKKWIEIITGETPYKIFKFKNSKIFCTNRYESLLYITKYDNNKI